jgi:CDP-6-deoxy-D-xylo-4-hexulose-3-dehydrase
VDSSYDNKEILNCIGILLSGQLTMGPRVKEFESEFSKFVGAPYSVMVNSGSSANLLVCSAITNPARTRHLAPGSKVAVPAVCWSTSLWPIVQMGLVPVLVDVDPETFNLSISSFKSSLHKHDIKALMMVHVLGNSTQMGELLDLVKENDLILVEDTCESLGTKYRGKYLGTFCDFGTFSFYFSHHMTTIEGGMIIAKNKEDYDLLKCLRTHGWSREQSNKEELESRYKHIDPRFLFINMGYNLRPMEIQAAFGLEQIKRLEMMNACRCENVKKLKRAFLGHSLWKSQLHFPLPTIDLDPCWFGFPFLIKQELKGGRKKFTRDLLKRGIDTRPIISGNMALQPAIKIFNVDLSMGPFAGAQLIHERGFFVGCHSKPLDDERIYQLVTTVLENVIENTK